MPIRIRMLSLLAAAVSILAPVEGANQDGSSAAVGNDEAVRLYAEANAYAAATRDRAAMPRPGSRSLPGAGW